MSLLCAGVRDYIARSKAYKTIVFGVFCGSPRQIAVTVAPYSGHPQIRRVWPLHLSCTVYPSVDHKGQQQRPRPCMLQSHGRRWGAPLVTAIWAQSYPTQCSPTRLAPSCLGSWQKSNAPLTPHHQGNKTRHNTTPDKRATWATHTAPWPHRLDPTTTVTATLSCGR